MKDKFIQAFMDTARIFARLSHCKRTQVGAIIVKDNRIISIGYNGMPIGWDNCCEQDTALVDEIITKPEVLHAESNAIAKLAASNESGLGSVMFCTHSPCLECAKLIYQSGISGVLYGEDYRCHRGILFLLKSGIMAEKVDNREVSQSMTRP